MFLSQRRFRNTVVFALLTLLLHTELKAGVIVIDKPIANSGKVFVLAVGIDEYNIGRYADLLFCESDAGLFVKRVSADSSFTEVIPFLLLGNEATKENIKAAFFRISQLAGPEDLFIFYDASMVENGNILLADSNHITPVDLYTWSQPILTSKQLFFLDFGEGKIFTASLKNHILKHPEESALCKQDRVVLSVSNMAMENATIGGGVFTATYVRNDKVKILDIFSESNREKTEFIYNLYNQDSVIRKLNQQLEIEYFSEKEFYKASTEKIEMRGGTTVVVAKDDSAEKIVDKGETLCLVIGLQEYDDFARLNNSKRDAESVRDVLLDKYNTRMIYMKDPGYEEFMLKLMQIQNEFSFKPGSQFLLFMAGHGGKNELGEGCVLLKDSKRENGILKNALAMTSLKRFVGQLQCTNSLIMMDMCHSGTMFDDENCNRPMAMTIPKTSPIYNDKGIAYLNFLNQPSRIFIGSSKDQKASDGAEEHSPFAKVVLMFFNENSLPVMDSYYLQETVKMNIMHANAISLPMFCMYGGCKDDGRFMFFKR